jgi:hypothetical protein
MFNDTDTVLFLKLGEHRRRIEAAYATAIKR